MPENGRIWDTPYGKLLLLLTYFTAVHTAFIHSYCIEASNPLTSFADFCFKDRLFEENSVGAIHIL